MSGAADALSAACVAALREIEGLGVYDGPPVQAAMPYAFIEAGPESDWGHKGGAGREVRIAVLVHDKGEKPVRLRGAMAAAESALAALGGSLDGWQLVTLHLLRSRMARNAKGVWTGMVEYRARMLFEP
jgi:hypothetical protein